LRFSYRLIKDANGFVAECSETDAIGEGKTASAAVESLRYALKERMFRPDAVAPPTDQPETEIELVLAESDVERPSLDLGGPGDVPSSR
jgi:hypothetical protein